MKNRVFFFIIFNLIISVGQSQNTYPYPSTGSLGIGTTSPLATLDVNGTTKLRGSTTTRDINQVMNLGSAPYDYHLFKKLSFGSDASTPQIEAYGGVYSNYTNQWGHSQTYNFRGNNTYSATSPANNLIHRHTYVGYDDAVYNYWGNIAAQVTIEGHKHGYTPLVNADIFAVTNTPANRLFTVGAKGVVIGGDANKTGMSSLAKFNVLEKTFFYDNVSIGAIDNKGYKLAVAGSAVAEKVVVKTQASWPDYVFQPGYNLRPLDSIAVYIQRFKHLPGMTTASEIEQNGVDLGATQVILLEKIEELTLYIIDQDKKCRAQQNLIHELQEQVTALSKFLKSIQADLQKLISNKPSL